MDAKYAAVAVSVAAILIVAAFFIGTQQVGVSTSTQSQSTSTTMTSTTITSITTGGNMGSPEGLQLQLGVNASSTTGASRTVAFNITVSEYNTLATVNNVTKASEWRLNGVSLGSCGTAVYPFGVALYRGLYTMDNASAAKPLQIYPVVPCPMLIRFISGYLFQPMSDLAVVLPSGPNATTTPMSANVTAKAEYAGGPGSSTSSTALGPGTYTVAAADEWGSVVLIHFTIGTGTTASSTGTGTGSRGTLLADFDIGPTQPVCMANATTGPAPAQYASIEAVVSPQPSGQALTLPVSWLSNGCSVSGSLTASLAPGSYSLDLSSCQFMGCSSSLPRSFVIVAGQSTSMSVSIDTGIR